MSNSFKWTSIIVLIITLAWLLYALAQRHPAQWQFFTAGGVHFIMAVIINRQFVKKNHNYLGIAHVVLMILFFAYAYLFL